MAERSTRRKRSTKYPSGVVDDPTVCIRIRFSPEALERIRQQATASDMTIAAWMRSRLGLADLARD
jgi:hypothetical protein